MDRRVRFVLGRFASRISQVTITLTNLRGRYLSCRIVTSLRHAGQIITEDADSDMMVVVQRAVDRNGELVRRELDRQREQLQSERKLIKK
jgi:hypothetical protein